MADQRDDRVAVVLRHEAGSRVLHRPDPELVGRDVRPRKGLRGTLIQDFYSAYNARRAAQTQYCLAHLLREFEKIEARQSGRVTAGFAAFRDRVAGIFRQAIKFHRSRGTDPPGRRRRATGSSAVS